MEYCYLKYILQKIYHLSFGLSAQELMLINSSHINPIFKFQLLPKPTERLLVHFSLQVLRMIYAKYVLAMLKQHRKTCDCLPDIKQENLIKYKTLQLLRVPGNVPKLHQCYTDLLIHNLNVCILRLHFKNAIDHQQSKSVMGQKEFCERL